MATLLPPPKRQRSAYSRSINPDPVPEPVQVPSVVVQFKNAEDGSTLGPAINLPADTGRDALQMLVNKLRGETEDPLPYSFHLLGKSASADGTASTRIQITSSIFSDAIAPPASTSTAPVFSPEDVFELWCEPQAVFRVRSVGRCSATLSGHSSPILCCAHSPTGRYAATGSGDATCRIWDMETETPKFTLSGHKGWVLCVEWDAQEKMIATGGHDGQVRLWDLKTGQALGQPLLGHTKWVTSLAFEPLHLAKHSSQRLASASKDGTVRVYNTSTRKLEFVLSGHGGSVNVVRWGGEGVIYTGSSDRTVKVWSGSDGKLVRTLSEHAHWVNTMALSSDFVLRTGPFDHTGKHPKDEEEAKDMARKRYQDIVKVSPETLITGSDDHTLFLWPDQASASLSPSATPKKPLARLTGHQKQVNHVAFSPDGRWIASAGFDNAVKLWEGRTGKFVASLRGHVAAVYRVAWSADSRILVSASKDSTLKLWDLKKYKLRIDLPGHTDEVYCVDFVADKVVSGGRDRTVKIWRN